MGCPAITARLTRSESGMAARSATASGRVNGPASGRMPRGRECPRSGPGSAGPGRASGRRRNCDRSARRGGGRPAAHRGLPLASSDLAPGALNREMPAERLPGRLLVKGWHVSSLRAGPARFILGVREGHYALHYRRGWQEGGQGTLTVPAGATWPLRERRAAPSLVTTSVTVAQIKASQRAEPIQLLAWIVSAAMSRTVCIRTMRNRLPLVLL